MTPRGHSVRYVLAALGFMLAVVLLSRFFSRPPTPLPLDAAAWSSPTPSPALAAAERVLGPPTS